MQPVNLTWSSDVYEALTVAINEARLSHNLQVDGAHLLLGFLKTNSHAGRSLALHLLTPPNAVAESIHQFRAKANTPETVTYTPDSSTSNKATVIHLSDSTRRLFACAKGQAISMGSTQINTKYILACMLAPDDHSDVSSIFQSLNVRSTRLISNLFLLPNSDYVEGVEFLLKAATSNDVVSVERAILSGVPADGVHPASVKTTALMIAAEYGHREAFDLLIRLGADVNKKNEFGISASDLIRW